MKLRVERDQFADAVTNAARAIPNRPSVPVLAGVMLRADGDGVTVSAYNYDVSHEGHARGTVQDPGAALVSGRLLAALVKALPNKPVELASVGAHLELVCGSARFTLPTMPVEDYPTLPALPDTIGTVDTAAFVAAINRATIAASRDDTIPVMTGVRVEFRAGTVALLATDRYRLAVVECPFNATDPNLSVDLLIPASVLAETAKTWTGGSIEVSAAAGGDGLVGFADGRRKTTSRLLDGTNYPPVRSLFPADDMVKATAIIPAGDLAQVVKRVALVAERTTPVLLTFTPGDTTLVVEAGGAEEARASEAMPISSYSGTEALTVGFNPQYLIDGLANLDTAHAHIGFVDAFKPAVIASADSDGQPDPTHRYLIMPIRVSR
ncbi:DNA polymerase III subunit beta [Verrucosispora sp. NA02020]|uniref:DNA polymerase III subunit beta n=1 Tax=Verrucosispora sp. NA02020 TaxID=2742132 RepID=UPI00159266BB|nr:DNA polymerase III subunit beta [Verrucosispora sp. NA02020]QKW15341.1 DNA polymerase III subunit beta [Verrucosispora sp. NA02020]